MTTVRLRQFGDPILRTPARHISKAEIRSDEIQGLITDMKQYNEAKRYGVGLAAPQYGVGVALSIIGVKPTPNHPEFETFDGVIINPTYHGIGRRTGMWEGCQSGGLGRDTLYAKALRYRRIKAMWYDEHARQHTEELDGFIAHVFQHETDHLNGILFIDRVRDRTTFMMASEYRKREMKHK
ncbi:peptide deformylase [Candidatus Saccharibacteria bacterium]|nr:peptide deformylase [Candidatus Saccharibacteria bacterium]